MDPTPESVGSKGNPPRDLFAELVEGVAALAEAREAKRHTAKKRSRPYDPRNGSSSPRGK